VLRLSEAAGAVPEGWLSPLWWMRHREPRRLPRQKAATPDGDPPQSSPARKDDFFQGSRPCAPLPVHKLQL